MVLLIANYRVTSFAGGYKLSRQKGKQWKIVGYHQDLGSTLQNLFELRVRVDTRDFLVNFNDSLEFNPQQQALISRIDEIKQEILRGTQQ